MFHMVSEEMIFKVIFSIFGNLVAMATNQNERWAEKNYQLDRGPLAKHFCKSFVKISAMA